MPSQQRKKRVASENEKILQMLDTIKLDLFNNDSAVKQHHHTVSSDFIDSIALSKAKLREKKVRRINDLLEDQSADSPMCHLNHFRELASNEWGLVTDRFRLEIWPILAESLPLAQHLENIAGTSSSSKDSCLITTEQYSTALNRKLSFESRSCSELESFDSARSSFGSDQSMNADNMLLEETRNPEVVSLEELQLHAEWNQVELDVHRTIARFPPNTSDAERRQLQEDLTPMIVGLLHANSKLRYYQGFHDVCLTLMLALDVDRAKKVIRCLIERGVFKNYLLKSLEESALQELQLMYVILHKCDPELERRLRDAELGTLFALSWPITWFSHALHSFEQIVLCFDLFLSSDALMPIYVAAALVLYRRDEIFAVEAEMPALHRLLSHIPADIDIEKVIRRAIELYNAYRPRLLQGSLLANYEQVCLLEGRQHAAIPPANTLQRRSLQSSWLISSVAVAGLALYWWFFNYQQEFLIK